MNSCPKINIEITVFWSCNGHPRKKIPCGAVLPPCPSTGGTPPIGGGAPARASRRPSSPVGGALNFTDWYPHFAQGALK